MIVLMQSWQAVRGPMANPLVVALKVLGLFLLGLVLLVLLLMWSCAAPSDASLDRQFLRHHSDFDALSRMSQEDVNVVRVADDFTRLKNDWSWPRPESCWGITAARWNEYRRLFKAAGVSTGWEKDELGNVYFIAHTHGLSIGGGSKGLVRCFSSGDPEKTFPPCTERKEKGQSKNDTNSDGYSYRRIGPDWYIFEEWR